MLGDSKGCDESTKRYAQPHGSTFVPGGATVEGWEAGSLNKDDHLTHSFSLAEYWRLTLKHRLLILSVFIAALPRPCRSTARQPGYSTSTMQHRANR